MVARSFILAVLALVLLALGPANALAADYEFTVEPAQPNEDQVTTFRFQGSMDEVRRIQWDLDGGSGFDDGQGATVFYTYTDPGPVTVRMRVTEDDNKRSTVTRAITVNGTPAVDFSFSPAGPLPGQPVTFADQVSDPEGNGVTLTWSFGDGSTAAGPSPTHAYASAGTYEAVLTATDEHGAVATRAHQVVVSAAPNPFSPVTPLRRIRPFPVVRIAGVALPRGARIRILSVRAPLGVRVRVRCRGSSCPVGSVARTSATRLMRFRRFERRLRAGTRLELFVRQAGRIGKYTRFTIRAGDPPARLDRCLLPGRARPVRCP